ncbi:MAG: RNA polymerase sigma factor [Myxococcales bacterium]|nr:RNA polymerase sigma factor [Myxococcales bacterium]
MEQQQWIAALQKSEGRACRRLVESYSSPLFAFFRGLGLQSSAAEDLLQETFLEVWRSLPNYRGDASPKTWVFLIGRRLAWKQLKQPRRQEPTQDLEEAIDVSADPSELSNQEEWLWVHQRREVLHQCIQSLPTLYREILLLHYMEELSYQEMADVLGIAAGTAKSRLSKALSLLRIEVQQCFVQEEHKEP